MRYVTVVSASLLVGCIASVAARGASSQVSTEMTRQIRDAEQRLAQAPGNPAFMFDLGLLRAEAGDGSGALALLEQIVAKKTGMDPEGSAFDRFKDDAAYRALLAQIHRDFPPVLAGTLAFTIPEPDLVPEGIAYDAASARFFVGSIHKRKIVTIARDGGISDFVPPSRDGLGPLVGLRVDSPRGLLWAAAEFRVPNRNGTSVVRRGVAAYELATGRLVRRALLDAEGHLPNDLVVTRSGDVYVTDSRSSEVYHLAPGGSRLERVLDSSQIQRPNGIALAPDESRVFIAAWPSIVSMDLRTKKVVPLRQPLDIVTAGIDGLYFHEGSLVGVQNDVHPGRVVRFDLSADLTTVDRAQVLAAYDPHFDVATTGAIANESLYVIANSQVGKIGPQGELAVPMSEMKSVSILKIPLGR